MHSQTTVDDYINAQPAGAQPRLRELRAIIRAAVPDATEYISYGMPSYRRQARRVYFGAARRHVALYGTDMTGFVDELRAVDRSAKGTLRFPLDHPLPTDLISRLVMTSLNRPTE